VCISICTPRLVSRLGAPSFSVNYAKLNDPVIQYIQQESTKGERERKEGGRAAHRAADY